MYYSFRRIIFSLQNRDSATIHCLISMVSSNWCFDCCNRGFNRQFHYRWVRWSKCYGTLFVFQQSSSSYVFQYRSVFWRPLTTFAFTMDAEKRGSLLRSQMFDSYMVDLHQLSFGWKQYILQHLNDFYLPFLFNLEYFHISVHVFQRRLRQLMSNGVGKYPLEVGSERKESENVGCHPENIGCIPFAVVTLTTANGM